MKPRKPGSSRKKIILYYLIGLVLPGIILGYMALRGIRNDQAFLEKESLKKLETISQTFFSEIDADLGRFTDEQTSDSIIYGPKKNDPSILILLVKDSTGSNKLITHQLLYSPAELLPKEPNHLDPSLLLKEGKRLEFAEQRYSDAFRFYQDRIIKTTNPEEKKEAMVALARLYKRMNQPGRAKVAYEEIQKEYRGSLLNGQIPLTLMAGFEIMKINRALGEESEMKINLQKSLELLLHPDCEYDANQFEMFFQSFNDIRIEPDDIIDHLFTKLEAKRARTESLIWFLGESKLIAISGNNHNISSRNTTYGIPVSSGELQAMYLSTENNDGIQSEI